LKQTETMSEHSRPAPAFTNSTNTSLPVVNLTKENRNQNNATSILANSNPAPAPAPTPVPAPTPTPVPAPAPAPSSQSVDEYAVLETLFRNEINMMDSYYGFTGGGLLNNGDIDALIENNTHPNNNFGNTQSSNGSRNSNGTSHAPKFTPTPGANNDQNQTSNNNQNINATRRPGSNNIDVDQHARLLGTTSIPNMNNQSNNTNPTKPAMNRPGLVHPNSSSMQHNSIQNQQHHQQRPPQQNHQNQQQNQQQQQPPIQHQQASLQHQKQHQHQPLPSPQTSMQKSQTHPHNMSNSLTNQSHHGHTVGPKPVVFNQQIQQNGQIQISTQPHQPPKPNGQQKHSLLGQAQQNWSSSALPQMQDLSKIDNNNSVGNQIPSQPALPNQNQPHSHQTHFPSHSHQNHLSAPMLAQPPKQQTSSHPQHQNHSQPPQRHLNQMQHPLPAPMQHRAPLSSPTLQLLSPPQQIQSGSFQQQNQSRPPQQKQNQMHHQKPQQPRPIQQTYQIQNKCNQHQQYHPQVQQLRQPPQLQPPQQYQNKQKPQQSNHQQQHVPSQQSHQPNNMKPNQQYQPQPQLQQKPQLQPQLQSQQNSQMQPQYQVQQHHQQQKMPQYIPQQNIQQSQPIQSPQHVQKNQQNNIHPPQPQHQQKPYPNQNQMQSSQMPPRLHQVQPNHHYQQQQQSHPPQQFKGRQQQQQAQSHQPHNVPPQNNSQSQIPTQNMPQYQRNQHRPPAQGYKSGTINQYPHMNNNQQHLQQPHLIQSSSNNRPVQCTVPQKVTKTPNDPQHEQRARQLVSQFASLATQLGIALPESVFSSLTRAATIREVSGQNNESKLIPVPIGKNGVKSSDHVQGTDTTTSSKAVPSRQNVVSNQNLLATPLTNASKTVETNVVNSSSTQGSGAACPPGVQNALKNSTIKTLEETANAAIAAISSSKTQPSGDTNTAKDPSSGEIVPSRTQSYTRKRKRPRLEDCMQKLAVLRNENETLKRHLDIVANKTQKFDMERKQTEQQLREMVKNGAMPEKMNVILEKFTRMYSDFGQHRHDELSFHLGQLEK